MFEILKCCLCHNVTANNDPIILRPQFYDTDRFVAILLSLRSLEPRQFTLTYNWLHFSGFCTTSESKIPTTTGITTYGYMSPVMLKVSESMDPSGRWDLQLFCDSECFIEATFVVERTPKFIIPSVFFDMHV